MNSCVATGTEATPSFSNRKVSCKLHVAQDPQSARASITASARRTFSITSGGAGLAKVGFISRITLAPYCSLSRRSRRSRKTLPPGLLMSSSAMVRPFNPGRRGAAAADSGATSFIGFTSVIGMNVSSNRIGDHLASARACGPASQNRRKFSSRSARDYDLNRLGYAEFLITRLAVDDDLFVLRALRDAIARLTGVASERHAGVLEQKIANVFLAETVAMNRMDVFRPQDDHSFKRQAGAIGPHGGERVADRLQDAARGAGVVFANSVRRFGREKRDGALLARETGIDVQRLPGILLFIFGDAKRKLAGISQRRHIDPIRPRSAEVQQ